MRIFLLMKTYATAQYFLALMMLVLVGGHLFAQDDPLPSGAIDTPVQAPIRIGAPVTETISDTAFFDWWLLTLREGDEVVIEMFASDGLEPLLGLLDEGMDLIARSDTERVERANGVAVLQYRAEEAGNYTIIATRNGNDEGTSTGSYRLLVTLVDERVYLLDTMPAEFRCGEEIAHTALSILFNQAPYRQPDPENPNQVVYEFYRLTVYGLDGFEPLIRIDADIRDEPLDCSGDARQVTRNRLLLPDGTDKTYVPEDEASFAQLALSNSSEDASFGTIRFLIAGREGTSGRYIAVLEGLTLQERRDADFLEVRKGALARHAPVTVYMVADADSRLNPFIYVDTADGESLQCNQAGFGACEHVPSWVGYGTQMSFGDTTLDLLGRRFDAGVIIDSTSLERHHLRMMSNNNDTHGRYVVYFLGELRSVND